MLRKVTTNWNEHTNQTESDHGPGLMCASWLVGSFALQS